MASGIVATVGDLDNAFTGREAMVAGVDKPTEQNTGAIMGFPRTVVTGNTTITSSGDESYTHYDFYGRVKINASGHKYFKNCRFFGDSTLTSNTALVDCTHANVTNVELEDCDLIPDVPTLWQNGLLGHDYTLTRCKIQHVPDGCGVYNTNSPTGDVGVTVQMCHISKLGWWYPDPNQTDGTHADGIQIQGGSDMVVRGNYIDAHFDTSIGDSPWSRNSSPNYEALSCLMYTPNVGDITDSVVDKNWLFGGEISVNCGDDDNSGNDLGDFTDNRFGHDQYYTEHTLDFDSGASFYASGNIYDDTEAAVTVRTNA